MSIVSLFPDCFSYVTLLPAPDGFCLVCSGVCLETTLSRGPKTLTCDVQMFLKDRLLYILTWVFLIFRRSPHKNKWPRCSFGLPFKTTQKRGYRGSQKRRGGGGGGGHPGAHPKEGGSQPGSADPSGLGGSVHVAGSSTQRGGVGGKSW